MEIDESDGIYASEISKANDFYIAGLKEKKEKKELERKYKKKLVLARENYNKLIVKILKSKKNEKKQKKKEDKKEEVKVEDKKYSRSIIRNIKIKLKIGYFRLLIHFKIIKEKLIPDKIFYISKKIKLNIKNRIRSMLDLFTSVKDNIIGTIKQSLETLNKNYNKLLEKSKAISLKIINYVKEKMKKKKEDKKEEVKVEDKKEDIKQDKSS